MKGRTKVLAGSLAAIAVIAVVVTVMMRHGSLREPVAKGGPATMRLISTEQYVNTVRYLFGEDIDLTSAHFPLLPRIDGLVAIGSTKAAMTPGALEMFNRSARAIASQVVDPSHRDLLVPCKPSATNERDDACAEQFLSSVGRFLFRRPMPAEEVSVYTSLAGQAASGRRDFYEGLAYALTGMMTSPKFLYIEDVSEPDPERAGEYRLDAFSKAARLSLFLWNALPDDELIAAAESGELHREKILDEQIRRMLASPRLTQGVRAFFSDLLQFQEFESVTKDAIIYPAFTYQASRVVHEQTLRQLTDHLLERGGDYRDLFTTNRTFVNRALGPLYRIPVSVEASSDEWLPYEMQGERNAGLLSSLSFLASHSHPGRSSPTLRGKALREIFLCQRVPAPPPTVDFSVFEDLSGKLTARERLQAHDVNPACKGCHKLTDPIGLAFENYDGAGQFRTQENGEPIDTGGEFDGHPIQRVSDIGAAVREHPALTPCLTRRLFAYGTGHDPGAAEQEWLAWAVRRFAANDYRFPDLLREMAQSQAFYAVAAPAADATALTMNTQGEGGQ
jgi:hypothetical protein